jgi:hypothetical protein
MDPRDIELIERVVKTDPELRGLWGDHRAIEDELGKLDGQRFLTPDETLRRKELQKAKLAGRDRIEKILDRHRERVGEGRV